MKIYNRNEAHRCNATAIASATELPGVSAPSLVILAIDDEATVLAFYEAVLGDNGVQVHTSTDPAQGVELAAILDPDLILLDLTMPGIGGMEALQGIRARDPEARVVMITGNYSIESAVQAIQAGATDFVCKPVKPEKLRKILQETWEHRISCC